MKEDVKLNDVFRHDDAKVIISHLNFFGGRADTSVFVKVFLLSYRLLASAGYVEVIPIIMHQCSGHCTSE